MKSTAVQRMLNKELRRFRGVSMSIPQKEVVLTLMAIKKCVRQNVKKDF